jgi:hypothetical protein
MRPPRIATTLTLPISLLVVVASVSGLAIPAIYAKELPSWAAQGIGQDAVNLLVVVPLLIVTYVRMLHGSFAGWLVWIGGVIYLAYSYALYAFFVHFGPLFPIYIAVLGLSFYAFLGSVLSVPREQLVRAFAPLRPPRVIVALLLVEGIAFSALWLGDIARAIVSARAPQSATDLGFVVNPVHVLDLAFALPAMIVTAVLLRRQNLYGWLFAVPLLVFSALMAAALAGMTVAMQVNGLPVSIAVTAGVGSFGLIGVALAVRMLRQLREPRSERPVLAQARL